MCGEGLMDLVLYVNKHSHLLRHAGVTLSEFLWSQQHNWLWSCSIAHCSVKTAAVCIIKFSLLLFISVTYICCYTRLNIKRRKSWRINAFYQALLKRFIWDLPVKYILPIHLFPYLTTAPLFDCEMIYTQCWQCSFLLSWWFYCDLESNKHKTTITTTNKQKTFFPKLLDDWWHTYLYFFFFFNISMYGCCYFMCICMHIIPFSDYALRGTMCRHFSI